MDERKKRLAAWAALMDERLPSDPEPLDSTSTTLRQALSAPGDKRW